MTTLTAGQPAPGVPRSSGVSAGMTPQATCAAHVPSINGPAARRTCRAVSPDTSQNPDGAPSVHQS